MYQSAHQAYRPAPAQQTNVIYKVATQSMPSNYMTQEPHVLRTTPTIASKPTNPYPLMDTTVASSVKGEPELNIGKCYVDGQYSPCDPFSL